MTAGEIRSSVISNNFASIHASGLFVSGTGKVIDCRIINNRASTASYRGGSTLRMGDTALVDRTIISGTDDLGVDNAKGLVYISGGTLRSSVVYGNSASNGVAGVYITNGSIINTTIYNNQLHTTGDASGLFIANDTAKIINTIVANNPAPEGIAETVGSDSCFINSATPSGIGLNGIIAPQFPFSFEENFILKKNSRLRNSGFYQLWMNDNPDFYGRPRIEGACVDIGATECYLPRATFFLLK